MTGSDLRMWCRIAASAFVVPEFKNILVIHFGQLGDVVLGLPALSAIRERFPDARITLLVGKSAAEVTALAAIADDPGSWSIG